VTIIDEMLAHRPWDWTTADTAGADEVSSADDAAPYALDTAASDNPGG